MARFFQYQAKTEPVRQPAPSGIDWHQRWLEPVRPKIVAGLAIALAASGGILPPVQPAAAAVTVGVSAGVPGATVHFKSRIIYQAKAEPVFVPSPIAPIVAPVITTNNIQFRYRLLYQSRAEPVFITTEVVTVDKWFSSWTEPVRSRRFSAAQQDSVADVPSQIVSFGWNYPWSEPVRQKPGLRSSLQDWNAYLDRNPDDQDFESKWHQPWSEPVRFKRLSTAQQQLPAWTPYDVDAQKVSYSPWSEPVRVRPGLRASLQDTVADIPFNAAEQIYYDKWGYAWSEPVRQKPGLRTYLQDTAAYLDQNPDDATFESKWHQPWSEPVRFRRLATAQQQSFAYGAPSFEVVTEDKWHFPWSEPVRQKPGLRSSLQDWNAYLDRNPDDQGFESKWHQSWSEPVRFRRFPTAEHQSLIWTPFDIEGQYRWFNPLSEPVRVRRFPAAEQQALAWVRQPDDQDIESKWHYAWSEPVRLRRISAALQQSALIWSPFFAQEIVTLDKWFAEWRNPVRTKSGLFVGNQQFSAWSSFTPAPSQASWHLPLSEPVRFRRFPTAEQQPFIAPVPVFVVPSQASWHRALSEPVRFRRFPTAEQQAFIGIPFNQDQRIEARWHYAWSEPVRRKLYPVFIPPVIGPVQVVVNQVSLVLDATETNNDSAIFDISVYNQAARCLVSIKEIPPPPQALFSIIEQSEIEDSPVSIKEID